MAKTIFEEMGGTYTQIGDYLLPDLELPEKEQQPIGVWGQRHRRYLKEHRRASYATLLTSGKLNGYLADIDRQAEEMFLRLVKQMAEAEGVTEQLKAGNQMEWVGRMNNIRNRAMEIVNSELICGQKYSGGKEILAAIFGFFLKSGQGTSDSISIRQRLHITIHRIKIRCTICVCWQH